MTYKDIQEARERTNAEITNEVIIKVNKHLPRIVEKFNKETYSILSSGYVAFNVSNLMKKEVDYIDNLCKEHRVSMKYIWTKHIFPELYKVYPNLSFELRWDYWDDDREYGSYFELRVYKNSSWIAKILGSWWFQKLQYPEAGKLI